VEPISLNGVKEGETTTLTISLPTSPKISLKGTVSQDF
jgi:hypothetical protein